MSTLAQRLQRARQAVDLTQAQLARATGLSQSTIGMLESGTNRGTAKIAQLARVLGVTPIWLADGVGPMHASDALPRSEATAAAVMEALSAVLVSHGLSLDDLVSDPIDARRRLVAAFGNGKGTDQAESPAYTTEKITDRRISARRVGDGSGD